MRLPFNLSSRARSCRKRRFGAAGLLRMHLSKEWWRLASIEDSRGADETDVVQPHAFRPRRTLREGFSRCAYATAAMLSFFGVTSLSSPVDKSKTNPRITTLEGIQGCDLSFSTCFCVCQFTSE